jgi:histidyl-tRNA synthetase
VRRELIEEKKLDPEVADKIGEYAKLNGGVELINKLKTDESLIKSKDAVEALDELDTLFKYTAIFNLNDNVVIKFFFLKNL